MLGHLSFGVVDLHASVAFYDAVLAPLGVVRVWSVDDAVGYGQPGGPDRLALKQTHEAKPPGPGFHLAFLAPDQGAVRAFYDAALLAGGACNGPPGFRPRYGPDYFAAFVVDPDGVHLEAKVAADST